MSREQLCSLNKTPLCQYAAAASEMPYSEAWPRVVKGGGCCGLRPSHRGAVRMLRTLCRLTLDAQTFSHWSFFVQTDSYLYRLQSNKHRELWNSLRHPLRVTDHPSRTAWTVPFCIRKKSDSCRRVLHVRDCSSLITEKLQDHLR